MAAYAALVSLMQILDQIEHHPSPPISMDKKQVESLTDIAVFLQEFLEGYKSPYADGDEADPSEMRIADAVYAAEDAIESHIVDQLVPAEAASAGSSTSAELYDSLMKVIEDMYLIKKQVIEMVAAKEQRKTQVSASLSSSTKSSSPFEPNSTTMVGFDDVMLQLMDKLTDGRHGRQAIPIVGMGGIGKTFLARNVYEKPLIAHHFDKCAWVTISQQYDTKELLCEILSQVDKVGKERLGKMSEDEIGVALHKCLSYRRYLVVLDDMWSIEAWDKIQLYFPDNGNGSRIVVTTRLSNLGYQLDKNYGLEMKFMDEISSWNMFCKIVFRGKTCHLELEKIGKEIVERCRGLPLSIVVMGGLLEKMEPTKECWEYIRGSINSLVNLENDKHCLKILKLSYNHLAVYLKPCYLYLGVFEEDCKIRVSTVIKLWISEGFVKPISNKSLETVAKEYLDELVERNLILVHKLGLTGSMKYLKMHDLLRDLCLREAEKERFYHVVGQHNLLGTSSQRCLVIPRNTSKKEVLDAIRSTPHIRSYISDYERDQLLPNLRLLRTLQACNKFSHTKEHEYSLRELFKLVNLRFLVVSHKEGLQLPSSINLPWSLQTLIVKSPKNINAPVEIWNIPQLRHVHFYVYGWSTSTYGVLHLPDSPPRDNIVIMENLQTLKGVSNFKCDEMMLRRVPNIKKLGIIYKEDEGIESRDDDYCVHNIERLQKLESLSCKGHDWKTCWKR
ncbi:late blight resistance protein R1-A-like isoform X2 [Salvia hispanica]|uniref:late blight resistance protein R1-A-like isoform X2 n=1 Tax=Salvia hispanica TaxID=49212 RepID=UPI00200910AD|nr:late blight resistance protein R1-A-like isoform X2 [Salvia hispanica]